MTRSLSTTSTSGFALPTILTASIVLIMVLVTAVSATVAVRTSLRDQKYAQLAELAAEAGNAYAASCMESNNGSATWTDATPLRPNTNCNGTIVSGMPAYTYSDDTLRTYFVVPQPVAGNVSAKGYAEALRSSTGIAWRVWGADVAKAATGTAGASLPIGTFLDGAWTTAPDGFLLANGAAVSRTTYADLFAVIGTTYGTGNGTTTFNLPDSRGKNSIALNPSDTSFDNLTDTGGEKAHTQTIAEMPSHTHGLPWQTNVDVSDYLGGSGAAYGISSTWSGRHGSYSALEPVGGGAAFNVLDPYMVVTRVIKY